MEVEAAIGGCFHTTFAYPVFRTTGSDANFLVTTIFCKASGWPMVRQGNNPKRRIADADFLDTQEREELADRLVYVGSAHHKKSAGDYGFHPPANPRPSKTLCDGNGVIRKAKAKELFRRGILMGLFSPHEKGKDPKHVWCVDDDQDDQKVYEANWGRDGYHGYPLEARDEMQSVVRKEWNRRCRGN